MKLYTNAKLERESDYHYVADAIVEGKSTVESAVSLATTEGSNYIIIIIIIILTNSYFALTANRF